LAWLGLAGTPHLYPAAPLQGALGDQIRPGSQITAGLTVECLRKSDGLDFEIWRRILYPRGPQRDLPKYVDRNDYLIGLEEEKTTIDIIIISLILSNWLRLVKASDNTRRSALDKKKMIVIKISWDPPPPPPPPAALYSQRAA